MRRAISDAARLGRATKHATLFCTTFPCHICTKHIVAAGIDRVVFLEPYPKSLSQKLHGDSITFETDIPDESAVRTVHRNFSPPATGTSSKRGLEDRSPAYVANEEPAIFVALRGLKLHPAKITARFGGCGLTGGVRYEARTIGRIYGLRSTAAARAGFSLALTASLIRADTQAGWR
jgi:hypothetical protein